jgi:hypothetical protein
MTDVRNRFWAEFGLAVIAALLCGLTLVQPAWIKSVFGVDSDGGSGAMEWLVVAALAAVALSLGALARGERRRALTHLG